MLSAITGIIQEKSASAITLQAGPFSFQLATSRPEQFELGSTITLYTSLHWSADHGPSLYGFATQLERTIFELVTSASGIGPKLGIAVGAQLTPAEFVGAISTGNVKAISAVSGIGPKKAEQLIVQLKHKVADLLDTGVSLESAGMGHRSEITQVLKSLNYSRTEIIQALSYLESQGGTAAPFDQLLRQALSFLSKRP